MFLMRNTSYSFRMPQFSFYASFNASSDRWFVLIWEVETSNLSHSRVYLISFSCWHACRFCYFGGMMRKEIDCFWSNWWASTSYSFWMPQFPLLCFLKKYFSGWYNEEYLLELYFSCVNLWKSFGPCFWLSDDGRSSYLLLVPQNFSFLVLALGTPYIILNLVTWLCGSSDDNHACVTVEEEEDEAA
jgi:hypothetical protein